MRFILPCMQCIISRGTPYPPNCIGYASFNDDGIYEHTCPKGHTEWTIPQVMSFELLFDIGANAILDGYYREAVGSFASSVERFYEHALRVMLRRSDLAGDLITDAWREIASQSERQLGAFIFMWANHFKVMPAILAQKSVTFRNGVVHKGKIPTRAEAVKFGKECLAAIRPQMLQLMQDFEDEDRSVVQDILLAAQRKVPPNVACNSSSVSTLISRTRAPGEYHEQTFEQLLEFLQRQRQITLANVA